MHDDDDVEISKPFKPVKTKIELENTQQGARIVFAACLIGGLVLVFANAEAVGRLAAYNAGLMLLIWCGHMVIAGGALRGHLGIFGLVRWIDGRIQARVDERAEEIKDMIDKRFDSLHARLDAQESRADRNYREWRDSESANQRLLDSVAEAASDQLGLRRNGGRG